LLKKYDDIDVVGEAGNVDEALVLIKEVNPDVVFLDIQMPEKTGFELLEMLPKSPLVVFITAYDEYALKAFQINALDYLLKPVEAKRLDETIDKIRDRLSMITHKETSSRPKSVDILSEHDQVFVKDGDRCWFVKLVDISLFESEGNYVRVYFDNFRPLIHRSLNALDERLDEKLFFRASRKHIINLKWIEKIEPWFNGGLMVSLKGGQKVEISRRQATKFKEKLSL
ncbi:MAG: LytTR family DNA-binding domain-containing protein, partial [Flammeovirgaceae bacterium]|nr:LytTR family DNA-binding domain-containing protein [Flammeovirgaceae bacterium]MDW8287572.1 LytTR family DNA-binding domain-containing protein [Flammeovirgaceae bacterium]